MKDDLSSGKYIRYLCRYRERTESGTGRLAVQAYHRQSVGHDGSLSYSDG